MKNFLITLVFFLTAFAGISQKLPEGDWKIFDADILGHIYLSDGTVLKKVNTNGKVLAEHQDQLLGDIYQIDCYKGLKILVFYKNTNSVLMLNHQMAPLGHSIELSDGGFFDVAAACLGTDDQLWIADEQTGQLKLIDRSLNVLQAGVVYRQYTSAENIVHFAKRGNMLLMVTSDHELLVFDHFGSFVSKHSFNSLDFSWIGNERLFYSSGNQALRFSYKFNSFDTISSINDQVIGIIESKNQLYLLEGNRITKLKK